MRFTIMDLIAHHDFRKRYIIPLSHYYYNLVLIYLNHLPNHIIAQILQYLPVSQLYVLNEAVVCTAILLIPINSSNTALLVIRSIQIVAVEAPLSKGFIAVHHAWTRVYWSVGERATDALVYVPKQSTGGSGISSSFYQL